MLSIHEVKLNNLVAEPEKARPSKAFADRQSSGSRFNKTKCYNCREYGHIAKDCKVPCKCGSTEHFSMDCQKSKKASSKDFQ